MYNAALYNSFTSIRATGGGIPSFWVGDLKTTQMDQMTNLLNRTPIAGIGISHTKDGSNITVKTNVEFFEDASGEYFLSVLILENGIDGSSSAGAYAQSGTENPTSYRHDFVLRASSIEGNAYGELILTNPENGESVENEYIIPLNSSWTNTVYPVAILWKKDIATSPNFKFINAAS
ncbi:MAG: Omp28-related outer membrane protein [Bacteroidales bacterium]